MPRRVPASPEPKTKKTPAPAKKAGAGSRLETARQARSHAAAVEMSATTSLVDRVSNVAADKAAAEFHKGSSRWKSADSLLEYVRAVPTIFPQIDSESKVGGWPVDRVTVIHGPSNNGKTELVLGLGKSFLQRGHFFDFVDAERSTPRDWVQKLFGRELTESPRFGWLFPDDYEGVRDAVREKALWMVEQREKKKIPLDTTCLFVVDSIKKLMPAKLWAHLDNEMDEKGANGMDGAGGRGGQIQAAFNTVWLNELIPLMHKARCGIALIAREVEKEVDRFASDKASKDQDIKLGGGTAVNFDASLRVRVVREANLFDDAKNVIGERTRVEFRKTKIGSKETKIPFAYFHTSNGVESPFGFDPVRDLLEMAVDQGIMESSGGYLNFDGERFGGKKAPEIFRGNDHLFRRLESRVRQAMKERIEREGGRAAF